MAKYRIADFVVELKNCSEVTIERARKYLIKDDAPTDFVIESSLLSAKERYPLCDDTTALYLYEGYLFSLQMFRRGGLRFHSSAVVVDDRAYLFSAPSGTGKSTHTSKWLELFGDRAYILNDDKPILRIMQDGIYAYGSPWSGKNDISVNLGVKLEAICFLTRSEQNWIKPTEKAEAVFASLTACYKKTDSESMSLQLDVLEKILNAVPVYKMGCTPTLEAAKMSWETMSGKRD